MNWVLADRKYTWTETAKQGLVWYAIPNIPYFSDFDLTVEGQRTGGTEDSTYGVVFRVVGNDYYMFGVNEVRGFSFLALVQGTWVSLVDRTASSAIKSGAANRIAVSARGGHFTFFINERAVGEFDDTRIPSGRAGVIINLHRAGDRAVFQFSNFEMRAQ